MQYRNYGAAGIQVSVLGFGAMRLPMDGEGHTATVREEESIAMIHRAFERGVNLIDTAWGYCAEQSQRVVGQALNGWRDRVLVSTKAPVWLIESLDDYRRYFDEQLRRLQVDAIDIYYFHGLSIDVYERKIEPLGILEEALRAKAAGRIRHLGFSTHDTPENICRLIDGGWAEGILCQYNLLDQSNAPVLAHAHGKGLGTAVMGPVGGGRLGVHSPKLRALAGGKMRTTAELALRFVLANPHVSTALSGMESLAMVEENTTTASCETALSAGERESITAALEETRRLADLYCTGCTYCMPCPHGVNIPRNFELLNYARVYGLEAYAREAYRGMALKPEQRADHCGECGECEPKCPQKIPIRRQLKQVHDALGA